MEIVGMTAIRLSKQAAIPARYANRHGLVTGATGTGKTISIMRLVESFSSQGVPVFVSDVKGDLAALSRSCPAALLDVYGAEGAPLRVPVSAFGCDLLARALELTDVQAGCLEIGFAWAADTGTRLETLADLRELLTAMSAQPAALAAYGHITRASVGTIQRALLRLESQGAGQFFGAPGFDIADLLKFSLGYDVETSGEEIKEVRHGLVSILAAEKLLQAPRLYSALLLWLLRELFQRLPEVGDMDKPRLVFVFDEAHTLFSDCPAPLLRSIEQTARLIRSKGVGIYFASQSPADIPEIIRNQCATRIAHDRALGVGRAYFDTLDSSGRPAARMLIKPDLPACQLGALSPEERAPHVPAAPMPAATVATISGAARVRPGLILSLFAVFLACLVGMVIAPSIWLAVIALGAVVALNLVPYPE
jgi:DNA helicase HerA-like ATPase